MVSIHRIGTIALKRRVSAVLITAKTLRDYKLRGIDGDLGRLKEFYFDDHYWTIRYLVVDTGDWLGERPVLISPYALLSVNKEERYISIGLTKKRIENSPSWDSDKPVSRQFEEAYHGYYGLPMYWNGPFMWGPFPVIDRGKSQGVNDGGKAWDFRLRSTAAVSGYDIHANDGEIGHVDDFVIDDAIWAIRYLVVDTRNWWPGKKVLVSPRWIKRVSWSESKVFVDLLRETVKQSPEYSEESLLTRSYETGLHRHYHRKGYWDEKPRVTEGHLQ
jgi:hypothetical protein